MKNYLTEDLQQIRRYFPGAQVVALEVPFDFTDKPSHLLPDTEYEVTYYELIGGLVI